ncbi:glycosyltransferase family 87 protein [Paraburkholderia sp. EG285A]|uniref:glycosyltransferase family 87 protein n=1 Tax=Paraburkholderia sp. EG285A TaxID=3237009 RepID=UPI0034D165D1
MHPLEWNSTRSHSTEPSWLSRERLILYSTLMIFLGAVVLVLWAVATHGFSNRNVGLPGADFAAFWSASHAVLHGQAAMVFDYGAFSRIEAAATGGQLDYKFLPWLYPPTFLLFVTPLAILPLTLAYFAFIAVSLAAFVFATLRVSGLNQGPLSTAVARYVVLAMPCVMVCAAFGQNALITAALAAIAVSYVERRPALAGICIGLLAIKPQLAVLFPLALIATRSWKVFWIAAITAALLTLASVALCGLNSLRLFADNLGIAREFVLEHNIGFLLASPTVFAALRHSDASFGAAAAIQAAVAIIAACSTWKVWRTTRDVPLRAAALATASLLVSPYVWHYELTWLGLSSACFLATGLRRGWLVGEQHVLLLAWLLPALEFFNPAMQLPQVGPVILLLMLLAILRRARIH